MRVSVRRVRLGTRIDRRTGVTGRTGAESSCQHGDRYFLLGVRGGGGEGEDEGKREERGATD